MKSQPWKSRKVPFPLKGEREFLRKRENEVITYATTREVFIGARDHMYVIVPENGDK